MAWVDICSKVYDSNYPGAHVKVVVQYDNTSITTTSITCRAIGYLTDYNGAYGDTYFIYSDGGGISRICYLGDTATKKDGSAYYTGNTFKLTKTKTTTYFSLPELRLCNDGSNHSPSNYTDSNGRGYAIYWENKRHMWTTVNSGGNTISTSVYVTNIGTGTVDEIKDNYNNSYTVKVTRGAARTYNKVNGALLYWTHTKNNDGSWSYSKASNSESFSTTSHSKTISFTPSTAATRQVAGAVVTDGEHNDTDSGWVTANIKQYVCPSAPGSPAISYTKSRLTIKEPWTFSWTAATKANDSSPVKGYRIRIYRKRGTGSWTTIDFHDAEGNKLTTGTSDKVYDRDGGNSNSFILSDPSKYFLPGDQVQVKINSFTKYGNSNTGDRLYNSTQGVSPVWTVQNAGVMRVKTKVGNSTTWKEGVVWVKVNKNGIVQWVEADIVKVKVNTSTTASKKLEWKESN